ncbi:hypothetical protein D3C84_1146140 [compost metagenome]
MLFLFIVILSVGAAAAALIVVIDVGTAVCPAGIPPSVGVFVEEGRLGSATSMLWAVSGFEPSA